MHAPRYTYFTPSISQFCSANRICTSLSSQQALNTERVPLRPDCLAILDGVPVGLAEIPRLEIGVGQREAVVDVSEGPLALLVPPAAPETP